MAVKTLMDLLIDAPVNDVRAVQQCMRLVAAGEWKAASYLLRDTAFQYPEGSRWADDAVDTAQYLRSKARD